MYSHMPRRACGSKPIVGSSRNTTSGSDTSAIAMLETALHATRVLLRLVVRPVGEAGHLEQFGGPLPSTGLVDSVQPGHQLEVLPRGQVGCHGGLLGRDADHLLDGERVGGDVVTHDRSRPTGRSQEAAEHLDRRGLAGTVRPEQREQLAGAHREVESGDGDVVAEPLRQAGRPDRGIPVADSIAHRSPITSLRSNGPD